MKTPWLRRLLAVGLAGLCLLGVAACSNSKKDQAYKNSKALPPLEVPPDLVNPPTDSSTAIPDLPPAKPAQTAVSAAPPQDVAATPGPKLAENTTPAPAVLHIEKQGAMRWLVVPGAVEQVQQRVKDFLLQKGFSFSKEEAGTLETEWHGGDEKAAGGNDLDAALKAGQQDKFKVRIEAGRVADTSEVTVNHFGLQRVVVDGKPQWQPRASDPMMEAELLDQLRAFLASEGTAVQPASDLPAVKAKVTTDKLGKATLRLNEDFDHAWRRIGLALGRGGFVIVDRNRSKGIYLIRMGTAFKDEAKPGLVSRLLGSNAGDPNAQYRIHVDDRGDDSAVIVEHPGGAPVHTSIGERILSRIKEKMG